MSNNKISDLTPLCGLLNLKCLLVGKNLIQDLAPLTNLYLLEVLYCEMNQISDSNQIQLVKKFKHVAHKLDGNPFLLLNNAQMKYYKDQICWNGYREDRWPFTEIETYQFFDAFLDGLLAMTYAKGNLGHIRELIDFQKKRV